MSFVCFSQYTLIISLSNINSSFFVMNMHCVFCEVSPEFLNNVLFRSNLKELHHWEGLGVGVRII